MTPADAWPRPPSCGCGQWHDGYLAGYLQGARDARSEIVAEQLEQQRRAAARMEPAVSVVSGLRAMTARQRDRRSAA